MHQCILSTEADVALCTDRPQYAFMHKGIDQILADLMSKYGDNQVSLSKATGVGQSTISRILKPSGPKGIKCPTDAQVAPLAKHYRLSTDQLRGRVPIPDLSIDQSPRADGSVATLPRSTVSTKSSADIVQEMLSRHGKGLPDSVRSRIENAVHESGSPSNVITADFSRPGVFGDEIRIAHYDVQGAMGAGKLVHDFPEMFRDVTVSQQHLKELGVTYKDPAHLKLITGDGQSMEPTIQDKDPLIADASIREFNGDGIYAFVWQGFFYIKRLQIKDSDHFRMISDNKHHDPETIRIDETYIQARILLVWNAQKL